MGKTKRPHRPRHAYKVKHHVPKFQTKQNELPKKNQANDPQVKRLKQTSPEKTVQKIKKK